jgi:uncharacterized protein YfiM (DUF2279 family)
MATTLSVSGASRTSFSLSDEPAIGSVAEGAELSTNRTIDNGTGTGQANAAWRNRVTIAAGQVYSLDLTALGATVFGFGGQVSLTKLKEVYVLVNTTTAGAHVLWGCIGPSDTTGYAARIGRGGEFRWADYQDGITITNSSNDMIYVANPSAGSVEMDLLLVGVGTYSDT